MKLTTFKSLCLIFRQKITKTNIDVLNVPIYDCTHQFVKQLLSIHFAPNEINYLWVYTPAQMQCKQANKIHQTKMVKLGVEDRTNYSIFSKELQFEDTTYKIIKRNVESPGGLSGVGIQFRIRRSLSQIVASHYLPFSLLVGISWLR